MVSYYDSCCVTYTVVQVVLVGIILLCRVTYIIIYYVVLVVS